MVRAADKSFVGASTVYEAQRGKTVNISIYIHGSEKSAGGSLDLLYDKTKLTVQKVELGDKLSGYMSSLNTDQGGKISLEWAKATGQVQDGTLLTITARLLKANATTALDLQNVQLFRADYSAISVAAYDGEVKPFKGITKKYKSKVKGNTTWTVSLDKAVNPATVNKYTVKVKDSRGNVKNVRIKMLNSKTLAVSPISNYPRGTYTLEVTDQIRTSTGVKLKKPIKYEFSV